MMMSTTIDIPEELTTKLNNDGPLLPENIANIVTAVSLATRISLRCSSLFFDAIFEAAKYGTSLSLGVSRNALTNAISTAKNLHYQNENLLCSTEQQFSANNNNNNNNNVFIQVLEKYTNIGLYLVSHSFSLAELFAMSGIQFTSRTIQSSLKAAEESVRIVDGIFGSNETSRAIASFISLVHRELHQDPEFELAKLGKIAILAGLTKAMTAFAVLQNVTHKRTMKQMPMTILWEGLVIDDVEDNNNNKKIIQFKNNNLTRQVKKEEDKDIIIQELNTLLEKEKQQQNNNNNNSNKMFKITTQTSCITTKTTTIYPMDSLVNKRIIVRTAEEENGSFLATLVDPNNNSFVLSSTTTTSSPLEKKGKKRVKRQETYHSEKLHTRRLSLPNQYITTTTTMTTMTTKRTRHASFSSLSCINHPIKKRSNSISAMCMTPSSSSSITSTISTSSSPSTTDIIHNISHYMKYASAAYGESFMRILGIGDIPTVLPNSHHHHPNHHAFAHHTNNSVEDILLSSYTDRSPLHLHNPSIHALVHYVTVDHATKAIVLTCRGTLGLSDILTDLSMNYTEFCLPNDSTKIFKAHSGMLDAAQLLAKEKGKVYQKIRQGLESYPDYGLVMCGHSLGGGVASLLCLLWSQQLRQGNFVTSNQSGLPSGRSIHCYAYGPPGVMSLSLSHYCKGLVTSIVHGYDIVSSLSLGLLKDFKNIATSLHIESNVTEEIISRVIGRIHKKSKKPEEFNQDDQWFWAMIKTMRADMNSEKMYPPSTVYLIETIPHIKNQHKVILYQCDDVKARFSEIIFTRTMFMDHSPLMYENAIKRLSKASLIF